MLLRHGACIVLHKRDDDALLVGQVEEQDKAGQAQQERGAAGWMHMCICARHEKGVYTGEKCAADKSFAGFYSILPFYFLFENQ